LLSAAFAGNATPISSAAIAVSLQAQEVNLAAEFVAKFSADFAPRSAADSAADSAAQLASDSAAEFVAKFSADFAAQFAADLAAKLVFTCIDPSSAEVLVLRKAHLLPLFTDYACPAPQSRGELLSAPHA
jgi:hypothetical protein